MMLMYSEPQLVGPQGGSKLSSSPLSETRKEIYGRYPGAGLPRFEARDNEASGDVCRQLSVEAY
jgi:hypothetical protein